ncbi:class I SAM-dependent DNA methyltransferase [Acetobacter oeni]|uniref:Methyltransferase n=1 Tax=Acetobacter oeni TaxID=304077 RepID=A0A511XH16_9PROT|nr:SAM-dependent methyltransferase [Acetobacter oeni]MBB3882381.1 hypothetical protein [Acetobacter oeni]NHO18518.1 methyltransferase domain-containing protein [Acetobacter oeni]GBR09345.1 SAM-dependent methyltransferase [Acetobacter oeni LMG 21952]GEN62240.1 methyltransferase [Acetobacter oeni]
MTAKTWPRNVFEQLYKQNPDPWGFETSPYEQDKYATTLALTGPGPFDQALELGCSIGVLTASLTPRCKHLLAVDIAETALTHARRRCATFPNVTFRRARLPDEFPTLPRESCDLILISELLYFLAPADILHLAQHCLAIRRPHTPIILVNWTGPTNTPCTGDTAADLFIEFCRTQGLTTHPADRRETCRFDRLT